MKKILFLLLLSVAMYGQVPADATPLENIQITNNVEDNVSTKVTVQNANGVQNWKFATSLPVSTATANALDLKVENSSGAIEGFAITNNGDGTVNIATGTAYLRTTNNPYSPLIKYVIPAVTNLALMDNANNFVLVDYNGGSPALTVTIAPGTINTTTNSIAYLISRVGTTLDYINLVGQNVDANGKLRRRFLNSESLRRASGVVLTASNRNLLLTAGLFYSGLIEATTPAFNTSTGSTFTQAYLNGSTWVRTTGNTQINNTQYSLAGVLTTMPSNDYRVDYVYALADNPSKLYVLLGTTTYNNISNARLAPVPVDLPTELQYLGARVGRVIIQKDATTTETTSEFATIYQAGTAQLHNDLGGLNLGDFQHLTAVEKTGLLFKATISQIRALTGTLPNNNFYTTDLGQQGNWYYDATDVTSTDNTGTILVTADGKRIKRVYKKNEINISWFITNKLSDYYSSGISITAGTNILNVTGASFDASYIGSKIRLYSGGVGGSFLLATISSINSPTQVVISVNASSTLTNVQGIIGGFDETPRFQTAIDILNTQGGKLIIPQGRYYIDGTVYIIPANMSTQISIQGENDMVLQDAWALRGQGVSIFKNSTGDIFRINMNAAGTGTIIAPDQYVGFSAKNMSFIGNDTNTGVNAFNIFRSRVNIQNISGHRIDYVIKQLATDIVGTNPTYCDMSLYKNIRVQQSKLGGLMLRYADNSTISELYFEGGDTNSKYMLEIYNTQSIFGYNFLHGVANNEQNTAGSALILLNQVFGGTFTGIHSESCNFESLFNITNCGGLAINGIETALDRNIAFKLSAIKGLRIDNWYDYSSVVSTDYDIDFGTITSNRDITWSNVSFFDTSQIPGVLRRDMLLNNTSFRGLTYLSSPVEYVSDMNLIDGNKQFRSKTGCTNLPSGLSSFSGTQYLLADNNNFRVQSGMGGDFIYTRYMSNGVWGNWNKVLNVTDLNNTALTGVPTAPTASANTNTTQVATTANVVSTINNRIVGTSGYIPAFNGANSLGDSVIRNSTTGIGIGGGANSLARVRLTTDTTHQYGLLLDTAFSQPSVSGIFLTPSFNSAVTTRGNIFRASANTTAEVFTLPDLRLFSAENGSFGAGSIVTDFTGFYVGAISGATNNYGFRGLLTSASNRWNLYIDGTAKNYLAGNTMVGSNVDNGFKFEVTGTANITGVLTAPTAALGTNTTQVATTAGIANALGGTVNYILKKSGIGSLVDSNISDNGSIVSFNSDSNFTGSATFQDILIANNKLRLKGYTVSTLPTGVQGDTAYVTDATAPTYLGTLTGGGSVVCPVFYNGTAWVSH